MTATSHATTAAAISAAESALQEAWGRGDGREALRLRAELAQLWARRRAELASLRARQNAGAWDWQPPPTPRRP